MKPVISDIDHHRSILATAGYDMYIHDEGLFLILDVECYGDEEPHDVVWTALLDLHDELRPLGYDILDADCGHDYIQGYIHLLEPGDYGYDPARHSVSPVYRGDLM